MRPDQTECGQTRPSAKIYPVLAVVAAAGSLHKCRSSTLSYYARVSARPAALVNGDRSMTELPMSGMNPDRVAYEGGESQAEADSTGGPQGPAGRCRAAVPRPAGPHTLLGEAGQGTGCLHDWMGDM
jgi:hypothetical protein